MEQPRDQMRFSVIVPAYNEAAYLGRALDSLLHQDYSGRYEVIVVDNNSTDGTAAIAAAVRRTRRPEPQQGVCAARQRGRLRHGEIIISTDADTTNRQTGCGPSMLVSPNQRESSRLPVRAAIKIPHGGPRRFRYCSLDW